MYQLWHVPTNTELGIFKTTKEVFDWFNDHPGWQRSDCVIKFYQLIETIRLK